MDPDGSHLSGRAKDCRSLCSGPGPSDPESELYQETTTPALAFHTFPIGAGQYPGSESRYQIW